MQNPDVLFFFEGKPEELALYEEFEKKVLEELGQIKIKVSKTQISFANRHNFAFVSFLEERLSHKARNMIKSIKLAKNGKFIYNYPYCQRDRILSEV